MLTLITIYFPSALFIHSVCRFMLVRTEPKGRKPLEQTEEGERKKRSQENA